MVCISISNVAGRCEHVNHFEGLLNDNKLAQVTYKVFQNLMLDLSVIPTKPTVFAAVKTKQAMNESVRKLLIMPKN